MLVIIETHCDPIKKKVFNKLRFDGFHATKVNGYVGGILVVWNEDSTFVTMVLKNPIYACSIAIPPR